MILVDTAVPEDINKAMRFPGISGFTTNPTLVARAAQRDALNLSDYCQKTGALCALAKDDKDVADFMIQGVGNGDQIREQAEQYTQLIDGMFGKHLWIKLLPTIEGINLVPALQKQGCKTLITGIFTAQQALVAMEAGADGIAVYLGRMMRLDPRWQNSMAGIAAVMQHYPTRLLLMASFPDRETVDQAMHYSRDLTLPPTILSEMLTSPHSAAAIDDFNQKVAL